MDMKKLLNIVSDKKQINESVEECGMPMGAPMPSTPPVTMNVSLNAQGVDNIKQLLDLMNKADASRMSPAMAMPAGGMDMPISIKKVEPAGSDGERSMGQIKALLSKMDELGSLANAPDEAYADIDAVTTDAGGGVNGPKDPADIRIKDPSPYEATEEEYANEPDEEYADHTMMIKDLSGGLNREKQQFKKEYPGDNPMAVREERLRSHLETMYREFKEGNMMPDPRSPEEKKRDREIQDLEMAQKKRDYERSPEYAKLKADAEKRRQDSDAETAKWNAEDEAYRKSRGMKPRGVK